MAEWFFPYLEKFVWGVSTLAEDYLIEGVSFLPTQVVKLLSINIKFARFFWDAQQMTLENLDQFLAARVGMDFYLKSCAFGSRMTYLYGAVHSAGMRTSRVFVHRHGV